MSNPNVKEEVIPMSCHRLEHSACPSKILNDKVSCKGCIYYAPAPKRKSLPKVLPGQPKLL